MQVKFIELHIASLRTCEKSPHHNKSSAALVHV